VDQTCCARVLLSPRSIADEHDNCPSFPNPNQAPGAPGSSRGFACDPMVCKPAMNPQRVHVNSLQSTATAVAIHGDIFFAGGGILGASMTPRMLDGIPLAAESTAYFIKYVPSVLLLLFHTRAPTSHVHSSHSPLWCALVHTYTHTHTHTYTHTSDITIP
jgi:hypothetical protein